MSRARRRDGSPWASWTLSILLHLGIVAIVAGFWLWSQRSRPPQPIGISGSVVTAEQLAGMSRPAPEPVIEEPLPEAILPELEPEPEPLPEEPLPPEEDPAVLQAQAEAERVAEERRVAEAQQAAERKAREDAAREQAERERREKERVAREKAEQEKAERERVARENAERQRRERELAERNRREAELAAQLAVEDRREAVRGSALANQYKAQIEAKIMRAWRKPPSALPGLVCEVRVTQVQGGAVAGVQIGRCNGDEAVRQSVEAAVLRASPLPAPPDPALFERELIVTFRPED